MIFFLKKPKKKRLHRKAADAIKMMSKCKTMEKITGDLKPINCLIIYIIQDKNAKNRRKLEKWLN